MVEDVIDRCAAIYSLEAWRGEILSKSFFSLPSIDERVARVEGVEISSRLLSSCDEFVFLLFMLFVLSVV
jgi:hypothetical protein